MIAGMDVCKLAENDAMSADIIYQCVSAYFEFCVMQLEAGVNCKIPSVGTDRKSVV